MRKSYIALGILAGVIGLMMLFAPTEWIKVTVILLGIGAVINGIYNLKTVRNLVTDTDYRRMITIRGFFSIVVGFLAVFLPLLIAGIVWTVMIYVLGVYLLLSAGSELFALTKLKEAHIDTKPYMYEVFFSIGLAVLLFIMPAAFGVIIVRIIGILIFLASAGFIFREWKNKPLLVYPEQPESEGNKE